MTQADEIGRALAEGDFVMFWAGQIKPEAPPVYIGMHHRTKRFALKETGVNYNQWVICISGEMKIMSYTVMPNVPPASLLRYYNDLGWSEDERIALCAAIAAVLDAARAHLAAKGEDAGAADADEDRVRLQIRFD